MSDNPVNRERSRHIDTRIHCVRQLVNDGVLKLHKVPQAGVDNLTVVDALTKSVPFPVLEKHSEYLWGSGVPFSALLARIPEWRDVAVFKLEIG
eukprot:3608928-Rhodomonas_salina.1